MNDATTTSTNEDRSTIHEDDFMDFIWSVDDDGFIHEVRFMDRDEGIRLGLEPY